MRLIDAEGSELKTRLKIIREAEYQIYGSGSWGFTAKCEHAIEDAPTVQPELHWIPCSERLPIEYNNPIEFLCTLELEYKNDVRYVDLIVWNGSDWENNYTDDNKYSDYGIDKVVAWMPLPEPYKGVTSIPSECEGDCGWCKPSVSEECKGMTDYGR